MILWLDDRRNPAEYGCTGEGVIWCLNVDQACAALESGGVTFVSLDHDVQFDGRNGMTVLCFMEKRGLWPPDGVCIHSTNTDARPGMLAMVRTHYGRDFQGPDFQQW